jgi:hypothetical protein
VRSSDRQGEVGTGRRLAVELSPGRHTLTLTATDSHDLTASASVQVLVGYQVFLALARR